jgi:hypothetical protein
MEQLNIKTSAELVQYAISHGIKYEGDSVRLLVSKSFRRPFTPSLDR